MRFEIALVLVLWHCSVLVCGLNTCYVSPTGNDSRSCLNQTLPCLTLQRTLQTNSCIGVIMEGGRYDAAGNCNLTISRDSIFIIVGNDSVIDCANATNAFVVKGAVELTVSGIRFVNGRSNTDGGCIDSSNASNSVRIEGCYFENCTSGGDGGAIVGPTSSSILIQNCTFKNNRAVNGGAISTPSGNVQFCDFEGNWAFNSGGAFVGAPTFLTQCTFVRNTASIGGAVAAYCQGGSTMSYLTILNNSATYGGGMYLFPSAVSVCSLESVTLLSNVATVTGGGMYVNATGMSMTYVNISLGVAQYGGGMAMHQAAAKTNNSYWPYIWQVVDISNNKASVNGGGLYVESSPSPWQIDGYFTVENNTESASLSNIVCDASSATFCASQCTTYNCSYCNGACDIQNHQCYLVSPYKCSGHGICVLEGSSSCQCDSGWESYDCSIKKTNNDNGFPLWAVGVIAGAAAAVLCLGVGLIMWMRRRRQPEYALIR